MSSKIHTETAFEKAIEAALLSPEGGWQRGDAANFSRQLALDECVLFAFLEDTQADQWRRLEAIHRGNARQKFLERLDKELAAVGMLDVLRNGITDNGVTGVLGADTIANAEGFSPGRVIRIGIRATF